MSRVLPFDEYKKLRRVWTRRLANAIEQYLQIARMVESDVKEEEKTAVTRGGWV